VTAESENSQLSPRARLMVLAAAFGGLLFDGMELGLMPVASLSISKSFLGARYTDQLGGEWFAWYTASLMLGAAVGGIALGALGDRIGRAKAMGASIMLYSVFAGMGAFASSQEQMVALRFLVGLGVGGVWPNGVALVAECWPTASKPLVAGVVGCAINVGILLLSQLTRIWPLTTDSWRWIFQWSAAPALLGLFVLFALAESPQWLKARREAKKPVTPLRELLRPPLLRVTLIAVALGAVALVGAWASSKWMIPWADKVGGKVQADYKSVAQGWWALGAALGSFAGAPISSRLGRQLSYLLISVGATLLTGGMFLFTAPLQASFLPVVFAQGFVSTLFFGWLPLYLPELFPVRVRAAGSGVAYNSGRFLTAAGAFATGSLMAVFGGDFAKVGAVTGLIYALGAVAIWWIPSPADR